MLGRLIMRLEDQAKALEKSICDVPPDSYAKFLELVGKRNGILQARDKLIEFMKEDDETE